MPYAKQRNAAETKTYVSQLLLQEFPLEEIAKQAKIPLEKVLSLKKEIETDWQLNASFSQQDGYVVAKAEQFDNLLIHLAFLGFTKSKHKTVVETEEFDANNQRVKRTKKITGTSPGDLKWLQFMLEVNKHRGSMSKLYEHLDLLIDD